MNITFEGMYIFMSTENEVNNCFAILLSNFKCRKYLFTFESRSYDFFQSYDPL